LNEQYEAVLNHLLFHKSIISEDDDSERIDRYLHMVHDIDKGMHIVVDDPFEKSIAAAFELVIEHMFDPWDINLREFTKMYLKQVKKGGYVNFVVAGKLVLMAWSILKLQSEEVLVLADPPKQEEENYFGDWEFDSGIYQESEDLDFTHAVMNKPSPPIHDPVRTQNQRPVTLIELVDAFDEARKEAELQMTINEMRKKAGSEKPPDFSEKVHKEDLNEDIILTWNRLCRFDEVPIALHNLYNHDIWDRVTVFVSALFLANMNKVKIWQRKFPYGEIMIKRLVEPEDGLTMLSEDALEEDMIQSKLAVV
jgi:segregation and condensation protein A